MVKFNWWFIEKKEAEKNSRIKIIKPALLPWNLDVPDKYRQELLNIVNKENDNRKT